MAKGYTTAALVAAQLGVTLTAPQISHLDTLVIPAVEDWIDQRTARAYGEAVVSAEQLYMNTAYTWLSKTPIDSGEPIELRGYFWNQTVSDLQTIPSTQYRLLDPSNGYIYFPYWKSYQYVEAEYTPDATIPDNVKLAATILACMYMRTVLHPETEWLTDYSSGQDIRLKFKELTIPQTVYDLLGDGDSSGFAVA